MKHCALQGGQRTEFRCYEDGCALWCNDKCAIVAIAEELKIMNTKLDTMNTRIEDSK